MTKQQTDYEPGEILLSADELAEIVARLGDEISTDYKDRNPILVNLLKGGVVFLADLMRRITVPHQVDFLSVSSYEKGTHSSGVVRIIEDLETNIRERDVLVVEDVLDTGRTLSYILNMLKIRSPRSLEVCSLLRKEGRSQMRVPIRYVGRDIPNVFVVGYGLDYEERFRHLPYIAKLVVPSEL